MGDELPESGLHISEERKRQLMELGGGDSDDEITESISELPQFDKKPSRTSVPGTPTTPTQVASSSVSVAVRVLWLLIF